MVGEAGLGTLGLTAGTVLAGERGGLPGHHAGALSLRPHRRPGDVPPTNHAALPAGKVRQPCGNRYVVRPLRARCNGNPRPSRARIASLPPKPRTELPLWMHLKESGMLQESGTMLQERKGGSGGGAGREERTGRRQDGGWRDSRWCWRV